MIPAVSYFFLQQYWWIIVSILASLLVFLMFVQGGQTLIYSLARTETEKTMIINTLGRKWEFTFTTLVTFGGAFFASFPLFYATSFGGAYWVWMAILFSFIIQAIAYEYRSKPSNFLGKKTYDVFLFLNGLLGTFLIGTAVGTFFTGGNFFLNASNQVSWANNWRGLEAVTSLRNLSLGFTVLFLARVLGLQYIVHTVDDKGIHSRSTVCLWRNALPFLAAFLFFAVSLLIANGFVYDPATGVVSMEPFKYLHNLLAMPLVLVLFLLGVVGVLWGIFIMLFRKATNGIWFTGFGTVLVVFALFALAGFNNTPFYPSSADLQSSLTIRNASSSFFTLKVMSWVSLAIPFVLAYIWYAWRSINNQKITEQEMKKESHVY